MSEFIAKNNWHVLCFTLRVRKSQAVAWLVPQGSRSSLKASLFIELNQNEGVLHRGFAVALKAARLAAVAGLHIDAQ
jgi:hypothetical protein